MKTWTTLKRLLRYTHYSYHLQTLGKKMHRSGSTSRFSDDHFSYYSSAKIPTALRALSGGVGELPVYEPQSETAKKEKSRAKFAENAVHVIPIVILLCCLVLWFFSNPDVDVSGRSLAAKVEGMGVDGDLDSDGTGHSVDIGELDALKFGESGGQTILAQNR